MQARRLLRARLPVPTKIGLVSQALCGVQAVAFLVLWIVLPVLFPVWLSLLPSLAILGFLGVAWGWPLYRASKFEGYNLSRLGAVLA